MKNGESGMGENVYHRIKNRLLIRWRKVVVLSLPLNDILATILRLLPSAANAVTSLVMVNSPPPD
ncbi:MAG: hypothetical protein JXA55_00825 [Bacteroidales bacterium]|nr:hypothetical protein [Bacteroidales bacterium]